MAESGETTTVIAAEAQIKGELIFQGTARILGKVDGKITAKGNLHVAERGTCKAQIDADDVQVDGTIEGNVTATQGVQLNASAQVRGDIVAEKMITAEGATIVGHVNVGPGAGKGGAKAAAAKAVEVAAATRPAMTPGGKPAEPVGAK